MIVQMDLASIGEFGGRLCRAFALRKDLEILEEDFEFVASTCESILLAMHDRSEFVRAVAKDLQSIETNEESVEMRDLGIEPPV